MSIKISTYNEKWKNYLKQVKFKEVDISVLWYDFVIRKLSLKNNDKKMHFAPRVQYLLINTYGYLSMGNSVLLLLPKSEDFHHPKRVSLMFESWLINLIDRNELEYVWNESLQLIPLAFYFLTKTGRIYLKRINYIITIT